MILSVNFSKIGKLHKPIGRVQFLIFEKFASAYYTKLREKLCNYFFIIYMKTTSQKEKTDEIIECVRAICHLLPWVTALHSCYLRMPLFSANQNTSFF